MEKRRRARINESLGQLKTLILDALKKDVSQGGEAGGGHGWMAGCRRVHRMALPNAPQLVRDDPLQSPLPPPQPLQMAFAHPPTPHPILRCDSSILLATLEGRAPP